MGWGGNEKLKDGQINEESNIKWRARTGNWLKMKLIVDRRGKEFMRKLESLPRYRSLYPDLTEKQERFIRRFIGPLIFSPHLTREEIKKPAYYFESWIINRDRPIDKKSRYISISYPFNGGPHYKVSLRAVFRERYLEITIKLSDSLQTTTSTFTFKYGDKPNKWTFVK